MGGKLTLQRNTPTILPLFNLHKIWFTNSMILSSSDLLSIICKKIYKCTTRILQIFDQEMTEEEFSCLVSPEHLLYIEITGTSITKSNGNILKCEEIVEKIPNAYHVFMEDFFLTAETFSNISKMSRINKFQYFNLTIYDSDQYSLFDIEQFKDFLKKCAAPKSDLTLYFSVVNDPLIKRNREELQEFLNKWIPYDEKPKVDLQ